MKRPQYMDTKTIHKKSSQNVERFLWENEEEATGMEIESMIYSALTLVAGMIIVVVTTIILIC